MTRWELAAAVGATAYKVTQKIEERSSPWELTFAEHLGPDTFYVSFQPVKWLLDKPTDTEVVAMLSRFGNFEMVKALGAVSFEKNNKGEEVPVQWHWLVRATWTTRSINIL